MAIATASELSVAPLGAGDLIDRAVRLYRRHLHVLLRIAAPPVVVSAVGSVLWTIAWRALIVTPSGAALALYILLAVTGAALITGGHIFSLLVMGGASRNLVTHLLWNEPVSVRATYSAVRSRFWSLLGASIMMMIWLGVSITISFVVWYMFVALIALGAILLGQVAPVWFSAIIGVLGFLAITSVALWFFFFIAGRIAYVPQVMLVEGRGVFNSLGRSVSLAKGSVRRLMAMTLFIIFATYSALMILVIPLVIFAWLNGVTLSPFSAAEWPIWYSILYSVLEPLSAILLAPVWMLGLSLLYLDERVRHEGYDIELMASRKLPAMPQLNVSSPFAPAISMSPHTAFVPRASSSGNVPGLI